MHKRQLLQDNIEKECESNRVCIEKRCSDPDQRQQEQARKQMTRKEQMHGKCLKDSIRIFLKNTGEGPVYACNSCHQTHFVDNVQDVASLQPGSHRTTLDSCLT